MKTYPKMKETSIPWLGKIPEHWEVKPLFTLLKERKEKNRGNQVSNLLSLSYGRIIEKDINSNEGLLPESFETYQIVEYKNIILRLTDLQNDQRSLRVGQVHAEKGIITSAYVCLEGNGIDNDYAFAVLFALDLQKVFYGLGNGVRQSMGFEDLKRLPFPVPPLDEQRVIAVYLDKATAKIDALIAEQEKLCTLLAEKRKALISHVVTKGLNPKAKLKPSGISWLGDIPEHWDVKRLRFLFNMYTGISVTKEEMKETGISCIGYGLIHSKYTFDLDLQRDVLPCVDNSFENQKPLALLKEGDFVFCDTSEDIEGSGNCVLVAKLEGSKLLAGSHTVRLNPIERMHARYIAYLFKVTGWKAQVQCHVTGTKVYSISQSILKDTFAILPPLPEQHAIVKYLDKVTAKLDALATKAEEGIALLKERRAALISEVVTGKVRVA